MGWDSNPRYACTHAGFQDRCLKPLGHPSRAVVYADVPVAYATTKRGLPRRQPATSLLDPTGNIVHRFRHEGRTAMVDVRHDLTRTTLAILFLAALIGGSVWILRPFLPAIIWAAMLAIATWPLLRSLEARLGGSRALAVSIMTLSILVIFVVPFWLAIGTIVKHSGQMIAWAEQLASSGL